VDLREVLEWRCHWEWKSRYLYL